MRFKRNVVTIAYAVIFVALMLLGFVSYMLMAYDRFSQDGFEWIFLISMAIAVVLFAIIFFLLREKATLKGIQSKSVPWFVIEGLVVVAAIGGTFYFCSEVSADSGIWVSCCLAAVYGICRILGGRLCALAGVIFSAVICVFTLQSGFAPFDSAQLQNVLTFLVPFFAFLLITKVVIPQFAKNSAVVILALLVLSAVFGAAISMNASTVFLCLGCVLALIFTKIRTVDTVPTKGFVMAIILLVGSVLCAFGVSILIGNDFFSLFSFSYEPGFEVAVADGSFLTYSLDKANDMFTNVMFHAFDYGLYPAVLILLAAGSGYAAIRRKLSEIGPMLLSMIALIIGYVIAGEPGSHNYYLTYMLGIFSAYGLFNMLLPEFLTRFQEDDEEAFDLENGTGGASAIFPTAPVEGRVANENYESASSDSDSVSEASDHAGATPDSSPSVPGTTVGRAAAPVATSAAEDMSHFMEWHVSEEFVREEKVKRAKQEEREKVYQEAKARQEAEKQQKEAAEAQTAETPMEDIQFEQAAPGVTQTPDAPQIPEAQPPEVSHISASRMREPEEVPLPDIPDEKPGRVVFVEQDVGGHYLSPQALDPYEELIPTPENIRKENIVLNVNNAQEDSEMFKSLDLNPQNEGGEMVLSESHRMDTDSLVMSGYQNAPGSYNMEDILESEYPDLSGTYGGENTASFGSESFPQQTEYPDISGTYGAEDILSAINETEVPTVEIPDVPVMASVDSSNAGAVPETEDQLSEVASSFSGDAVDNSISPGDDEKLDDLLDRLDMSDSIRRLNASAREDMADVIEQEKNKDEDEVVLVAEDYGFGSPEGEYGEVPTISELEDRWRAEEELSSVPEDQVPDVVNAAELSEEMAPEINVQPMDLAQGIIPEVTVQDVEKPEETSEPEDEFSGFDFDMRNYYDDQEAEVASPGAAASTDDMLSAGTPDPEESLLSAKEDSTVVDDMEFTDFTTFDMPEMAGTAQEFHLENPESAPELHLEEPTPAVGPELQPEPVVEPTPEAAPELQPAPQMSLEESIAAAMPGTLEGVAEQPAPQMSLEESIAAAMPWTTEGVTEQPAPAAPEPTADFVNPAASVLPTADALDEVSSLLPHSYDVDVEPREERVFPSVEELISRKPKEEEDTEEFGDVASEAPDARFSSMSFRDMVSMTTPEPVQAAAPQPVQAATPESVQPFVPERIQPVTPESVRPFTPERVQAAAPVAPEPVPSVTPEPAPSVAPTAVVQPEPKVEIDDSQILIDSSYEPVKPAPEPVVNRTDESPVYRFTKKDDGMDTDQGSLGIPKPGDKPISSYVDRYAAAEERQGKPIAASLDRYERRHEKEKEDKEPVHTEEVVTRGAGGSRFYHRIVLK